MKTETEAEAVANVGEEAVSDLGQDEWLVRFPNGAQYRMHGSRVVSAEGTMSLSSFFRFRFRAEDGRWKFEALDSDGQPWDDAKNELTLRASGPYDDAGDLPEQSRRLIFQQLVRFRQRTAWLFYPP